MSEQITGYSVAGVIEADPDNEFVWVKFADCQAAVAAAEQRGREDAARDVEALRNRWNGQHDVVQLTAAVAAARGEKP
jgi:hypothetical protein